MSMDIFSCPVCKVDNCVPPSGPKKSKFLIVGSFPSEDEIKQGRLWVGRMGGILRTELARFDLDINFFRLVNLWQHEPNKKVECLEHGAKIVIREGTGRDAILLIGAETTKYFCGLSVDQYNGLLVTSTFFSAPIIIVCVSPSSVYKNGVGEIRFALKEFSKHIGELR